MRRGQNPAKAQPALQAFARHRVIMPIYIPQLEGYFAQGLEVLKLALESLRLSVAGRASVTLISNGCLPAVVEELQRQQQAGWVDQLVLNQCNRGKIDAVVGVARGAFEPLITIADCDVLFCPGWLEAVESLFYDFPECGFAAPVPSPGAHWYHTSATLLGGAQQRELCLDKVVPDEDLDRFAQSIGRPDLYPPEQRRAQLVLRRGSASACVGSGHFICTLRREVLGAMPRHAALSAIEGGSEERWLDLPPDRMGFWRLSTTQAYAYHMGNVLEPWMLQLLEQYQRQPQPPLARPERLPAPRQPWASRLPWRLRSLLVRALRRARAERLLVRMSVAAG